jgi:xylulokinase
MSLLAIDIGSSACKAIVFATGGQVLARHSSPYPPLFPQPGFAEMDPVRFWDAIRTCSREVSQNLTDAVEAIGLSSHGETFVAVNSRGEPLGRAILNQDNRAIDESAWCEQHIARQRLFQITGLFAHPMYPLPKILWLRKHEPQLFASTHRFVTLIGYLLERMGLPAYVDYSLASRFLAFDIRKLCWSDEILAVAGLDGTRLPVPAPAGTIAGKLSAEIATELGVEAGTRVILGGHDQPCAALGAGVTGGGRVSDSIGTYECLVAASESPVLNEKALEASLNSYCHVVPGKFVTLAFFPSGIMVKWFHDLLYTNGSNPAAGAELEASHYAFLEAQAPQGPTGMCITPHLIGTCNPDFNPSARGVIAGLSPGTNRYHIFKGILEGLACELTLVTEALARAVGNFEDIYVTGGGARSRLGLELRAALTGRRLHVMRQQEAVCLGTAILAGVAIGQYEDMSQAAAALAEASSVIIPDSALTANYREQMKRYRHLRSAAGQQTLNSQQVEEAE